LAAANLNQEPRALPRFLIAFLQSSSLAIVATGLVFCSGWPGIVFQDSDRRSIEFGLGFLWGTTWDVDVRKSGGFAPYFGSVVSSILALLLAIPLLVLPLL
jgi:phosphate transport system permease protein